MRSLLKIFTTQLIGRLKKIESEQNFAIEDAARLLAQAHVGEGKIYIYAEDEMSGVFSEIRNGQEPLDRIERLTESNFSEITDADRALIFSRDVSNEKALAIGKALEEKAIPFVAICSAAAKEENPFEDLAYVFVNLYMDKGLVPTETGGRTGYPSLIAALYVYHNIKILLDEMLEDYE